jgi:chromate transporter
VVGVIANLSAWFALHVLFASIREVEWGPVALLIPDPLTLRPLAMTLAVLAAVVTFRLKWGMVRTLALCAVLGALSSLA